MDVLKEISDAISSILGLLGILLFGYILLMGMAHKAGKTSWFEKEKEQRILQGKPNIRLLSDSTKIELPWKDTSLIQGGFTALRTVGILCGYVVTMLIFMAVIFQDMLSIELIIRRIAILMAYPVSMGVFVVVILAISNIRRYKLPKKSFYFLFVVNAACAISTWLVFFVKQPQFALILQIVLLLVVSLYLSYLYGTVDGIKDATIEMRFPLVSVVTSKGDVINRLRLYEKTDTDYRFISEDGIIHIFPSLHIAEIKHVPEKNSETLFTPMPKDKPNKLSTFINFFRKLNLTKRAADGGDSAPH